MVLRDNLCTFKKIMCWDPIIAYSNDVGAEFLARILLLQFNYRTGK